jgi:CBS domain-containing protein
MAQSIQDVMTPNPTALDASTTVQEAARAMRDQGIGDVIVCEGDTMCGILTDRDIVVRALAEGRDPQSTKIGEICSRDVTTVAPDETVEAAIGMMREKALRRIPVVDGGRAVGIVTIGDLAIERDADSALADISAAPPNE